MPSSVAHMLVLLFSLLLRAMYATKASPAPLWDSFQACDWNLKVCGDGTWVYRDPAAKCAFPECWVAFYEDAEPTPTPALDTSIV